MVARRMSSHQTNVVTSRRSHVIDQSHIDRYLVLELIKLQLRRRVLAPQRLIPRMNLYQDDSLPSAYALFELPGIREDSVYVDVSDDMLTVEGERGPPLRSRLNETLRARQKPVESREMPEFSLFEDKYVVQELNFGKFHRKVQLPAGTKASDVRHELKDGMLLVMWPHHPILRADAPSPSVSLVSTRGST